MLADDSVTHWLDDARDGQEQATFRLWERYQGQLERIASRWLGSTSKCVADEEDVVVSVFDSFFRRAANGQFTEVQNRDDLWRVLLHITKCKALNQVRDQNRLKRGGVAAGETGTRITLRSNEQLDRFDGDQLPPDVSVAMVESLELALEALGDDELRRMALLRLDGHTCQEIAERTGRSIATVARRLTFVRNSWKHLDRF